MTATPIILFSADGTQPHLNACLNYGLDNWAVYADGYLEGATRLVAAVTSGPGTLDTLIYPIVYCYRQYIELRLKQLAKDACHLLDRPFELKSTHRLTPLWADTKRLLEDAAMAAGKGKDAGELAVVDAVINAFDVVDALSVSFRYPEDKQRNPLIPQITHINVAKLEKELEVVRLVLEGADSQLAIWQERKNEWLASRY